MVAGKVRNLEQLLDRVEQAVDADARVTLGEILEEVGRTSFSPLLLLAGLITSAPVIGDIPGVPTLMAVLVALTAGQLLLGRRYVWLPQWMLKRSVTRERLCKAVGWMRRPARFVDHLLRPRLTALTQGAGTYAVAIACLLVAAAMPASEFIPFSANGLGAALLAFSLALLAGDGLVALIAFAVTGATFALALLAVL
ncbi:MAG: exopolysaccharide biosynthesis protein [Thiohalomonadaceae bacterium]